MRVIVTGSREWTDREAILNTLDVLFDDWLDSPRKPGEQFVLVHGMARGADTIAESWYQLTIKSYWLSLKREPYKANWKDEGRKAGVLRNNRMIASGADLCAAFIADHSKGATHCATQAGLANISTLVLRDPPCECCLVMDLQLARMGKRRVT